MVLKPQTLADVWDETLDSRVCKLVELVAVPGVVQPHIEQLPLASLQALLSDFFIRLGGLHSMAQVKRKPPGLLAAVNSKWMRYPCAPATCTPDLGDLLSPQQPGRQCESSEDAAVCCWPMQCVCVCVPLTSQVVRHLQPVHISTLLNLLLLVGEVCGSSCRHIVTSLCHTPHPMASCSLMRHSICQSACCDATSCHAMPHPRTQMNPEVLHSHAAGNQAAPYTAHHAQLLLEVRPVCLLL